MRYKFTQDYYYGLVATLNSPLVECVVLSVDWFALSALIVGGSFMSADDWSHRFRRRPPIKITLPMNQFIEERTSLPLVRVLG